MARAAYYTFSDVTSRLLDFCGSSDQHRNVRIVTRAILDAYRDLPNARNWTYYYTRGRIVTDDDYSTGTITFDFSGGAAERLLTLSGGTWPTNAAYGIVVIDDVEYRVATRESSTTLTLDSTFNPGADVAAGTSYQWYRDTYNLPRDMRTIDQVFEQSDGWTPTFVHPTTLLAMRRGNKSPAQPRHYTFLRDPDNLCVIGIQFESPPDAAYTLDYIGMRVPNPLQTRDYSTGTVTCSASATVTGSGTSWTSAMVGSIFRVTSGTETPDGIDGDNPFAEEGVIKSVTNTTTLVLEAALTGTYSAKKYRISDPIDLEPGAMYSAFIACCKKNVAWETKRDDASTHESYYKMQLQRAAESDSRSMTPRMSGSFMPGIPRIGENET